MRLLDAAAVAGWKTECELIMGLERLPDPPADGAVREGTLDEVLALMRTWLTEDDHPPATVSQLVDRSRREHAVVPERRVVADHAGERRRDGDRPARRRYRAARGRLHAGVGARHRPRARGRPPPRRASPPTSGADVVFIVADDHDWPKELYANVGFSPLARRAQLHRPAEPGL